LFVHADVPQEARDAIAAVAEEVMASEEAQRLAMDTGALIYWQPADEAAAQIERDAETLDTITGLLSED
jgi:tripartite-type tricarboxylate transporter receptor subunit TctC